MSDIEMVLAPWPETGLPIPPPDHIVRCVDSATGYVCEAQFVDEETVLVRPVTPDLFHRIRRIPIKTFYRDFEEFYGDELAILTFQEGWPAEFLAYEE